MKKYDKWIFTSEESQKEWENLEPEIKSFAMRNLKETASKMENKIAIEMLCMVISELIERIEVLERRKSC